jgi:SAM-dependent methyltransferase
LKEHFVPVSSCRVCGHEFRKEPLLRYENMPGAAQFLPDGNSVKSDKGVDLEVCQCSGCGLVQLSGGPVSYYRDVIRAAAVSEEMKEFRRKQFGSFVEDFSLKGKKVIEIGCGRGEFLSLMSPLGVAAYGLEHSEESVAACNSSGLKVARGFIDDRACRLADGPFDAFFILNFLEHLPDPNETLGGICNNLVDGAVGLVEVPNFDMIVRQNLFSEFIGDHLLYFTRETLITAVGLNGFAVVECQAVWHDYIISAVVRKRPALDLSAFHERQARLKKEIDAYLSGFGDRKVAIWGAGHQALALMSLLGLAGRIRYVVDSAPFKQGKYTPATHLPIVAPSALDTDPVEAIIVMAASYSDEVAGIVRRKYGGKVKASIVRDFGLEAV